MKRITALNKGFTIMLTAMFVVTAFAFVAVAADDSDAAGSELIKIEITKEPKKLIYNVGDNVDFRGIEILATYADGTTETVNDTQYIGNVIELNTPAVMEIKVSYTVDGITKYASFDVEVFPKLLSMTVTKKPNKTVYDVGETVDFTGMVVTANFTNNVKETIPNELFGSEPELKESGTVPINLYLTIRGVDVTTSFDVTVNSEMTDITIYVVIALVILLILALAYFLFIRPKKANL
jgi:hypothetical protein